MVIECMSLKGTFAFTGSMLVAQVMKVKLVILSDTENPFSHGQINT